MKYYTSCMFPNNPLSKINLCSKLTLLTLQTSCLFLAEKIDNIRKEQLNVGNQIFLFTAKSKSR